MNAFFYFDTNMLCIVQLICTIILDDKERLVYLQLSKIENLLIVLELTF